MPHYFLVFKPFGMLSQFTPEGGKAVLGDLYKFPKDVYPVGRLDADSEGLLILTNDKRLNNLLLDPKHKHKRTYLVQVEGTATEEACKLLCDGMEITVDGKAYKTFPAEASLVPEPSHLPERTTPIRFRKNIPTSWISISLVEGKNRQVRKMTAKAGFPTLRIIRTAIEELKLSLPVVKKVVEMEAGEIYGLLKVR